MSTKPTPYEDAVFQARSTINQLGGYMSTGRTGDPAAAFVSAGKMVAQAILALAESNRPQPAVVNVSVTDVVAEKVQEAAR